MYIKIVIKNKNSVFLQIQNKITGNRRREDEKIETTRQTKTNGSRDVGSYTGTRK